MCLEIAEHARISFGAARPPPERLEFALAVRRVPLAHGAVRAAVGVPHLHSLWRAAALRAGLERGLARPLPPLRLAEEPTPPRVRVDGRTGVRRVGSKEEVVDEEAARQAATGEQLAAPPAREGVASMAYS